MKKHFLSDFDIKIDSKKLNLFKNNFLNISGVNSLNFFNFNNKFDGIFEANYNWNKNYKLFIFKIFKNRPCLSSNINFSTFPFNLKLSQKIFSLTNFNHYFIFKHPILQYSNFSNNNIINFNFNLKFKKQNFIFKKYNCYSLKFGLDNLKFN